MSFQNNIAYVTQQVIYEIPQPRKRPKTNSGPSPQLEKPSWKKKYKGEPNVNVSKLTQWHPTQAARSRYTPGILLDTTCRFGTNDCPVFFTWNTLLWSRIRCPFGIIPFHVYGTLCSVGMVRNDTRHTSGCRRNMFQPSSETYYFYLLPGYSSNY